MEETPESGAMASTHGSPREREGAGETHVDDADMVEGEQESGSDLEGGGGGDEEGEGAEGGEEEEYEEDEEVEPEEDKEEANEAGPMGGEDGNNVKAWGIEMGTCASGTRAEPVRARMPRAGR